jgi:hypothetical protein
MRLAAVVLAVGLASPMLGQALIEYGGAMAPSAGFAAHPANPAANIHHKQIMPAESPAHPAAASKRTPQNKADKDGSFARRIQLSTQSTSAQQIKGSEKKISDSDAITIQR